MPLRRNKGSGGTGHGARGAYSRFRTGDAYVGGLRSKIIRTVLGWFPDAK